MDTALKRTFNDVTTLSLPLGVSLNEELTSLAQLPNVPVPMGRLNNTHLDLNNISLGLPSDATHPSFSPRSLGYNNDISRHFSRSSTQNSLGSAPDGMIASPRSATTLSDTLFSTPYPFSNSSVGSLPNSSPSPPSFKSQASPQSILTNSPGTPGSIVTPATPGLSPYGSAPVPSPVGSLVNPSFLPPHHSYNSLTTKHVCSICGDRASGKHYGVFSCEGCKGFFKRTVRKEVSYSCRDDKNCSIDKRQRNRCQYCRYQKCLSTGMRREAVQEERQRNKELAAAALAASQKTNATSPRSAADLQSSKVTDSLQMPIDRILEAELSVDPKQEHYVRSKNALNDVCVAADTQLQCKLVEWARRIPHFDTLPTDDQVSLLKAGWNELLIVSIAHRSIPIRDGILLITGILVDRETANSQGFGHIVDRIIIELVDKMRELDMDRTELGCLRAIVLYNPDIKTLQKRQEVEALRERVYTSLEQYCQSQHPDQPGRFAKLLLRLPALRSISLKTLEQLFKFKSSDESNLQNVLFQILDSPSDLLSYP